MEKMKHGTREENIKLLFTIFSMIKYLFITASQPKKQFNHGNKARIDQHSHRGSSTKTKKSVAKPENVKYMSHLNPQQVQAATNDPNTEC